MLNSSQCIYLLLDRTLGAIMFVLLSKETNGFPVSDLGTEECNRMVEWIMIWKTFR